LLASMLIIREHVSISRKQCSLKLESWHIFLRLQQCFNPAPCALSTPLAFLTKYGGTT
jgi:hypothetical protein